MRWVPVNTGGRWELGQIDNRQARALTAAEVTEVAYRLNCLDQAAAGLAAAIRGEL